MSSTATSRQSDKFMVRLPEGMRERLAAAARANRRSMNAELIVHLETALAASNSQPAKPAIASN
ncbi:Arc family DNA-binding protein [uncultured Bosea sp.]|uniref:Arc family DNA-binding protein n=1 Tax=uncultured Bosea sp. TaxID=211457 RepID=UPI0025D1E0D9|nr:Arc family DNA-binding protein [uncultured Bosea sp.]